MNPLREREVLQGLAKVTDSKPYACHALALSVCVCVCELGCQGLAGGTTQSGILLGSPGQMVKRQTGTGRRR